MLHKFNNMLLCLLFLDSDAMKALDHRQGEKLARDFIKRQRAKQTPSTAS